MKRSKEAVKIVQEAKQGKERLDEIRFLLKTGRIDYDKAQELATEPLENLNKGLAVLAKEHGFRPQKARLASFLR